METLLEFARGPLFRVTFAFMILGLLRHLVITIITVWRALDAAGDKKVPWKKIALATLTWLFPFNKKIKNRMSYSLLSIAFHIGLLITPLFLLGHILLWDRGAGVSWPGIPNMLAHILTVATVIAAIGLVSSRLLKKDSRELSRVQDILLPLLLIIPFISGFMMMHPTLHPFGFTTLMLVHTLSAELIFILIPTTKLSHCILLPTTQLVSDVGWRFPPNAGDKVVKALAREHNPI